MKIAVAGIGFVGISNGILLAQNNEVVMLDIDKQKIEDINNKISPIKDREASEYLSTKDLNIRATADKVDAYTNADYVIIATPTDYNPETNFFNTSLVEMIIKDVAEINKNAVMVVKSTIPIGFIDGAKEKYGINNIMFSPEFLREGMALKDNLNPSRIIVGENSERARVFAQMLLDGALVHDAEILLMQAKEAESVKLFANGYLAMRVSFFNELDSYAKQYGLKTENIIKGVSLDPRIGDFYNNPSFGYGGYCFPKDTKQLLANFKDTPNSIIAAIVTSNEKRKKFIGDDIMSSNPRKVGFYRLTMKEGSDNFRSTAVQDIILYLKSRKVEVVIYEPEFSEELYEGCLVERDLDRFKRESEVIVANRIEEGINDVLDKVYTRDIFNKDT